MLSVEYREAMVEILDILDHTDEKLKNKIPQKLIAFWRENQSTSYKPNLDHDKSLNEMNLKDKTKAIIAMISVKYLCNEKQKQEIQSNLRKNEETYQNKLREKYNPDFLVRKKTYQTNEKTREEQQTSMIEVKETFFRKIINKIRKFFQN